MTLHMHVVTYLDRAFFEAPALAAEVALRLGAVAAGIVAFLGTAFDFEEVPFPPPNQARPARRR